jgi:hypothetical protein
LQYTGEGGSADGVGKGFAAKTLPDPFV